MSSGTKGKARSVRGWPKTLMGDILGQLWKLWVEFDETGEAMRRKCDFCTRLLPDPQITGQIFCYDSVQANISKSPLIKRVQRSCSARAALPDHVAGHMTIGPTGSE